MYTITLPDNDDAAVKCGYIMAPIVTFAVALAKGKIENTLTLSTIPRVPSIVSIVAILTVPLVILNGIFEIDLDTLQSLPYRKVIGVVKLQSGTNVNVPGITLEFGAAAPPAIMSSLAALNTANGCTSTVILKRFATAVSPVVGTTPPVHVAVSL
jgi:hypothetical protein